MNIHDREGLKWMVVSRSKESTMMAKFVAATPAVEKHSFVIFVGFYFFKTTRRRFPQQDIIHLRYDTQKQM